MKSFKQFIKEDSVPKQAHEELNKRQMNALRKHPSYKTYIDNSIFSKVYIKPERDRDRPGSIRNVILTNAENKYKMYVAITHHGKVLGHSIYKKGAPINGMPSWDHVKTVDGK